MILPPLPILNLPNPVAKLEGNERNPAKAKVVKLENHLSPHLDLTCQNLSLLLPTPLLLHQTDPH